MAAVCAVMRVWTIVACVADSRVVAGWMEAHLVLTTPCAAECGGAGLKIYFQTWCGLMACCARGREGERSFPNSRVGGGRWQPRKGKAVATLYRSGAMTAA